MRCAKCGKRATVRIKFPKLRFCDEHFVEYFEKKIERNIRKFKMFTPEDKVLVAISGGKDSGSLIHAMKKLGYDFECIHVNVGIGKYSKLSEKYAKMQAKSVGCKLHVINVKKVLGKTVEELESTRPICSVCGQTRRYLMNLFAVEKGFDVLVTGHNLEDLFAFIMCDLLVWETTYMANLYPVAEAREKLVKKVRPMYNVTENEIVVYASLEGIESVPVKCKYAHIAKSTRMKKLGQVIDTFFTGAQYNFVVHFVKKRPFKKEVELRECKICGMPSLAEVCSFCKLWGLNKRVKL